MNNGNWNNGQNQEEEEDDPTTTDNPGYKKNNVLPLWGNERTMNMNPLVLTNIQSSSYFKTNLYGLKTYHEVLDEIYYKVEHLEPWEKGSRKTGGQTGMCGGVRGVGAGGIVSTAYCLLYKLFTLKMTRKQLNGLINHTDSPYIRALGFMYIRYTQPPPDLWSWYEEYLEDEEELDVKAGGGSVMTIGNMLRAFLTKLEWHGTLFPRIPVPIQQKIEKQMSAKFPPMYSQAGAGGYRPAQGGRVEARHIPDAEVNFGEAQRQAKSAHADTGRSLDGRSRPRYDKDDRYKTSSSRDARYASPERKKHRDDGYRDKQSSSKHDKYGKEDRYTRDERQSDRYSRDDKHKDDRYSRDDRHGREDKYKSERREDRYKHTERAGRHNQDRRSRSRSPRHRRH